ncbi:MAG: glycosyl hydrolase family 65 protein [Dermabacter sp.]|nr:glycosyl hydrolase family 65 protein [Dermabacter sp.]
MDRVHLPIDEWQLVESRPGAELGFLETIFATANGYLGMRATPEEGRDAFSHGTFLNGFHETWPITHAENAFGFAKTGQTIVNAPDSTVIKLYVDDEPLITSHSDLLDYKRWIDFREGVLRRSLLWRTPSGKHVRVTTSRMVSFTDRHLALMEMTVEMVKGTAPIVISSQVINRQDLARGDKNETSGSSENKADPRQTTSFSSRVLRPEGHSHTERRMLMGYRTAHSDIPLAVGADHEVSSDVEVEQLVRVDADLGRHIVRAELSEGSHVSVKKSVAYHYHEDSTVRELFDRCRRTLDRVREHGFESYHAWQSQFLHDFWDRSDVRIAEQPALQQASRWCIYQLAQSASRADQLGVPAKGMTGSGYEGHYFWDTDIYVVPFLTFTSPDWARNALRFRVNLLDAARERAFELNQRGALFPWRTINGQEASAYYAAGTAQYHIDADIAWALSTYHDITGDEDFMHRQGAEVLAETARMWADLGFWRTNGDPKFHIHGVTGPDEYTTVVNNNLFTNVMAKYNLARAAEALTDLRTHLPEEYEALANKIDLDEGEIAEWQACADGMHIEFDDTIGIHPQDDRFLEREVWDIKATPEDKFPLLLNFHPLVIYRFQVIKQADVVLALYLRGSEFSDEHKRANFEYYDPITTGDSTLSAVVQSIMAAEVGHRDLALNYFLTGLFVDLADLHHNTRDGVHIASAGGVWNALVAGFGGMRFEHGEVSFDPRLPEQWPALEFPLTVRGSRFTVRITEGDITLTLNEGEELDVSVRGRTVRVKAAGTRVRLSDQGIVLDDEPLDVPLHVGEARADGTVITSTVPDPESPWEYPAQAPEAPLAESAPTEDES